MDKATEQHIEAAVFRRLLAHLDERKDVQNIDLMNLAGFCRNCLAKWYTAAAEEAGEPSTTKQSRERVYGMPYDEWKRRFQGAASPEQLAGMAKHDQLMAEAAVALHDVSKTIHPRRRGRRTVAERPARRRSTASSARTARARRRRSACSSASCAPTAARCACSIPTIPSRIKGRLGYLPEEKGLYKKMRVLDLVAYFGRLKGMSRAAAYSQGRRLLDEFELGDWHDQKCESLSKGMGQKVQIVATLIHDPELIVLDEPFSGLDPVNVELVRNIVLAQRSPQSHRAVVDARDGAGRADLRRPDPDQSRPQVARRHAERHPPHRERTISIDYDGDGACLEGSSRRRCASTTPGATPN